MSVLATEELTKDYGRFRALDALTLSVAPGEVVGLLGPNGSGKTTALRLILGFMRPTAGRATVGGFDCWQQSVEVRKRVADGRELPVQYCGDTTRCEVDDHVADTKVVVNDRCRGFGRRV